MTVYVLIDEPQYDPSNVIGVYSTFELAESARLKHATHPSGNVDPDYSVYAYAIDVEFPINS